MPLVNRKRPRIGDVVEIETPRGLAYAQYVFRHTTYGAIIRVLPGLFESRPDDFCDLVNQSERFFILYPVGSACHQGLAKIVAHEEIPEGSRGAPSMRSSFRYRDHRSGQMVEAPWRLWNGEKWWWVGELTDEQRELSLMEGWGHPLLVERIVSGWRPSDEG
jgi:hypothetical protein